MSALSTVRAVEEASLNAWPAHQTMIERGWLLRFAQGYTRRANSVNPIYWAHSGTTDRELAAQVTTCEAVYQRQQMPTIFKLTPIAQPNRLDQFLHQRGYREEAHTEVRIRPLVSLPKGESSSLTTTIEDTVSDEWIDRFAHFNESPSWQHPPMKRILRNILPKRAFVTLWQGDEAVSCGLGVVEKNLVGIYDIVTAETARGKGYGTQLLYAMLEWGKKQGASLAYLQVMEDNTAACKLYTKLGFDQLYRYWYRISPAGK